MLVGCSEDDGAGSDDASAGTSSAGSTTATVASSGPTTTASGTSTTSSSGSAEETTTGGTSSATTNSDETGQTQPCGAPDSLLVGQATPKMVTDLTPSAIGDNNFYRAADDFVVPQEDGCWCISRVVASGAVMNAPTSELAEVAVYEGGNAAPIEPPTAVASGTPEAVDGGLDIALSMTIVVGAGTHWLSVMPTVPSIQNSSFGWHHAETLSGDPVRVKTDLVPPFVEACLEWGSVEDCPSGTTFSGDLAFEVYGVVGGTGC